MGIIGFFGTALALGAPRGSFMHRGGKKPIHLSLVKGSGGRFVVIGLKDVRKKRFSKTTRPYEKRIFGAIGFELLNKARFVHIHVAFPANVDKGGDPVGQQFQRASRRHDRESG